MAVQQRITQATATLLPQVQAQMGKVTRSEGPLAHIARQLYVPAPAVNASSVISCDYTGATGLRRYERLMYQVHDDVYQDPELRYSEDNGRTWGPWQEDHANDILPGKNLWWQWNCLGITAGCHDPASGLLVSATLLRGYEGGDPRQVGLKTLPGFSFFNTSSDDGRSFGPWQQLRYEAGPEYSQASRETPEFLGKNQCWYYFNILALRGGGLVMPVVAPTQVRDDEGQERRFNCPRCFRGEWDAARRQYTWSASAPISISPSKSGYLEEPWLAELSDGRLLLDMRGTNGGHGLTTPGPWNSAPGRHWYALSNDGGRTWSEVRDWRFDNGEQFYSPATMAKILRHKVTGKLYWFGNISRGPVTGNLPRYPFYIAEIDENQPALKKSTLTVIDDCAPGRDSSAVQFSNFFVFENRQSHEFELYLSPYGQYGDGPAVYQADVVKYLIQLR